eukprot:CAMPEP_0201593724 /NCGR_PEP_ID=MMETSP0190_2-20130828/191244_1 /ASSEMBLY_ACC=CAM_ASM_000263 /TAXON_ID=37353 /ORGANISM="Rosalina sp." /LENGTH=371 /DNA_ID=CAMNT_0048053029 /DNA_START=864 /DNA_END=1979 /DNA_ORIENTATION=-
MTTPHFPLVDPPSADTIDPSPDYTLCDGQSDPNRQKFCKMLQFAGSLIESIIEHLKDNDLYDNTIINIVSDNGAQPVSSAVFAGYGQTLPLRGIKASVMEGGIRTPAFMTGGIVDNFLDKYNNGNGCEYNGLMYIADWFTSILGMTKIKENTLDLDLDGINVWKDIKKYCKNGQRSNPNRRDEIIQMRMRNGYFYSTMIRNGEYKLVVNASRQASNPLIVSQLTGWVNPDYSFTPYPDLDSYNVNIQLFNSECYNQLSDDEKINPLNFETEEFMLFKIDEDPIEACNLLSNDVNGEYDDIFTQLFGRILDESVNYNGGGFGPAIPQSAMAQVLQFNCDLDKTMIVPWDDETETDWNIIWKTLIELKNSCDD